MLILDSFVVFNVIHCVRTEELQISWLYVLVLQLHLTTVTTDKKCKSSLPNSLTSTSGCYILRLEREVKGRKVVYTSEERQVQIHYAKIPPTGGQQQATEHCYTEVLFLRDFFT